MLLTACSGNRPCVSVDDDFVALTESGNNSHPMWSPDGSKIAFDSNRDGDRDIYVMDADGSNVQNITDESSRDDWRPAWSPDGNRIAFVSSRNGDAIHVVNADGSGMEQITERGNNTYPAWSPDGSRIAFQSSRGRRSSDIYLMDPDGSNVVNLTCNRNTEGPTCYSEQHPSWSPDGSKIAFDTNRDGNIRSSYIMDADGLNVTKLTGHRGLTHPVFSPNGRRVAFQYTRIGRFERNDDIVVTNADGSDIVQLTDTTSVEAVPAWSPDGRCIAFSSHYGRRGQIYLSPSR